jgi:glycosyltransferase involved in cell wall biosynthesis
VADATKVLEVLGNSAGGVAKHVGEVAAALDGTDGRVVEVAGPRGLPVRIPQLRYEVKIPDGVAIGHFRATRKLRRIIAAGNYDVVHAHGLRAGVDAAGAGRGRGARVIVTLHNLALPGGSGVRSFLHAEAERAVLALADVVVAPSGQIAEHLEELSPKHADRIVRLHVAVPEPPPPRRAREAIRAELGADDGKHLVVTAARLAPQKDLPTMMRAVASLEDAVLAVLGDGPSRPELVALIDDLGVSDRVKLLGWRDDVYDYLRAADVFCLSSVWEAVSLSAQEAAQVGTPIVATDVGGIGELVEDGASGRLVPVGDADALAAALAEVLGSPGAGESFARAAGATLEARFGRAEMLARLRELYGRAGE